MRRTPTVRLICICQGERILTTEGSMISRCWQYRSAITMRSAGCWGMLPSLKMARLPPSGRRSPRRRTGGISERAQDRDGRWQSDRKRAVLLPGKYRSDGLQYLHQCGLCLPGQRVRSAPSGHAKPLYFRRGAHLLREDARELGRSLPTSIPEDPTAESGGVSYGFG